MKYLVFVILFILASCNPCKYVAKHPECFQADTIRISNDVIHYEKEYITNDSIIRDTIPCDPITKTYYKTETVYKTKTNIKIDTIYRIRETSRINPINEELKKENENLSKKIKSRTKMSILLVFLVCLLMLALKFK